MSTSYCQEPRPFEHLDLGILDPFPLSRENKSNLCINPMVDALRSLIEAGRVGDIDAMLETPALIHKSVFASAANLGSDEHILEFAHDEIGALLQLVFELERIKHLDELVASCHVSRSLLDREDVLRKFDLVT